MRSRSFLLAANWKMNPLTVKEAERIARSLEQGISGMKKKDFNQKIELVLCPPAIFLGCFMQGKYYKLGIQNIHGEPRGAYTGEIATRMAEDLGCKYVILGHSERRKYFGETDQSINLKLRGALKGSLNPIVCVGETKNERDKNQTTRIIKSQLERIFDKVSILALPRITIAYEPVWAISTAEGSNGADNPNDVMGITILIRKVIAEMYRSDVTERVRTIYGGSVNAKNIESFLDLDILDGFLVGGASISTFDFLPIIRRVYETRS